MNACRNIVTRLLAPLGATIALGFAVPPAYAVHDDGIFQVDGDAFFATCGSAFGGTIGCTGDDWDDLYSCTGIFGDCSATVPGDPTGVGSKTVGSATNSANVIATFQFDPSPVTIFTGGGSKDEQDITQWAWVNGSVPDKDDIVAGFAALYVDATPTRAPLNVLHRIVYFGANRLAVNGDAQIGFWFLQNPVTPVTTTSHAGIFVDATTGGPVHHKEGDVLVLSNFVQGGGNSNIQVYIVTKINTTNHNLNCNAGDVETKAPAGGICTRLLVSNTQAFNGVCTPLDPTTGFPADAACAATNGGVVASLDPAFLAKSGAAQGFYPAVGFFEGGIDLTSLGLGGECFSTFAVETRSSQSITAVLKDFTMGNFQHCEATIATQIRSGTPPNEADVTTTTVTPGTVLHDVAVVTGTQGAPDPGSTGSGCVTGTKDCKVVFKFFAGNDTCSGTPTPESVLCVSDTGQNTCTARSSTFTTGANICSDGVHTGCYSYLASYNGDSNYAAISLPATECETVYVGKVDSATSTDIYQTADATGASITPKLITDSFADINSANPTACQSAGGTCDYTQSTPLCSVNGVSCVTTGKTIGVRDQALVKPLAGSCGDSGQLACPTGMVTFVTYANADCSGTGTVLAAVNLGTDAPLCNGTLPANSRCAETLQQSLGASGLSFRAIYSGDSLYNASVGGRCEPVCAINSAIAP